MLFGVVPFGLTTGIAMVASGIAPLAAVAMSLRCRLACLTIAAGMLALHLISRFASAQA